MKRNDSMKKRELPILLGLAALLMCLPTGCGRNKEGMTDTAAEAAAQLVSKTTINIAYGLPKAGEAMLDEAVNQPEDNHSESGTIEVRADKLVKIAVIGTTERELLEQARPFLRQQGYELEIVGCEDYESPNRLLAEGEVDGNFYQHGAYLERYKRTWDTRLYGLGAVYYEPMGIYLGKCTSLKELKQGARIGVPEDPTGYSQALLLLAREGLIDLAEDADIWTIWEDVTANPYELELVQMEEEKLPASLEELDLALFHTGYGLWQGLEPENFLALEGKDSLAAEALSRVIAVREEANEQNADEQNATEGVLLLLEILKSNELKAFVSKQYQGSILILD